MLIAVTSSDGINVDTHFGKAPLFYIYETGSAAPKLMATVAADAYCNWSRILQDIPSEQFADTLRKMQECAETPPAHRMMPEKLAAIAHALGDCRVVVTAMIGEAPQAELERLGLTIYALTGQIATLLPEVAKLH